MFCFLVEADGSKFGTAKLLTHALPYIVDTNHARQS
jgi:hypothetical protein